MSCFGRDLIVQFVGRRLHCASHSGGAKWACFELLFRNLNRCCCFRILLLLQRILSHGELCSVPELKVGQLTKFILLPGKRVSSKFSGSGSSGRIHRNSSQPRTTSTVTPCTEVLLLLKPKCQIGVSGKKPDDFLAKKTPPHYDVTRVTPPNFLLYFLVFLQPYSVCCDFLQLCS